MPLVFVSGSHVDAISSVMNRVEQAFLDLGFKSLSTRRHNDTLGVLVFPRECRAGSPARTTAVGTLHTYGFATSDLDDESVGRTLDGDIAGFEQLGRSLDGPFLLALESASRVRLVTDRMGACHSFVAKIDGTLVVSTAALPLARAMAASLDPHSVREFLAAGSVFGNRTLFEGVQKLDAGTVLNLELGQLTAIGQWFRLSDILFDRLATGTAERWADEMVTAMRRIAVAVPHPVLDLTGGFDSRGVLAAALAA